jgi:hypothetical protein
MAMASYDTKADKTTTTESDEKKHACEQCNIYKEDITKLLAVVTEIQNKQDVECQITAETDAKIKGINYFADLKTFFFKIGLETNLE